MEAFKILIVGAGATGGALGTRLLEAGRDVTFLVRPGRAAALAGNGLRFVAPDGDRRHPVKTITDTDGADPFDLVFVAVKAPAIPSVMKSMAGAVGPATVIVPILNGLDHLEALEDAYPGQIVGGLVKIVATVGDDGQVEQMTRMFSLTIGALSRKAVPSAVAAALDVPGIDLALDENITDRLWEKWAFIAAAGAITCLFRNSVGNILAGGGREAIVGLIAEAEAVAAAAGHPVGAEAHRQSTALLLQEGSAFTSSLYRDLLRGDAVEAGHILGALIGRADTLGVPTPLTKLAMVSIRAHEAAQG